MICLHFCHFRHLAIILVNTGAESTIFDHRDAIQSKDKFVAPFGLEMKYIGAYNPAVQSYTVSMKYNFTELRNYKWHIPLPSLEINPYLILPTAPEFHQCGVHLHGILAIARVISSSAITEYDPLKMIKEQLPPPDGICSYLNQTYFNHTLIRAECIGNFTLHLKENHISYYTVKFMTVFIEYLQYVSSKPNKSSSLVFTQWPKLNRLNLNEFDKYLYGAYLNITVIYKKARFATYLQSNMKTLDARIDTVFNELNAYIPRFETMSHDAQPNLQEKRAIFSTLLTLLSTSFSVWKFYRDYRYKQHLKKTLRYILQDNHQYKKGIATSQSGLITLAEVTGSTFRKQESELKSLQSHMRHHFKLLYEQSLFRYRYQISTRHFLYHYVNYMDKLDFELDGFKNALQTTTTILYMQARTFVSGLHVLSEHRLPESIIHADTLTYILTSVDNSLAKNAMYSLLYGKSVYPYYSLPIASSFIVDNVLYMTLTLPLKRRNTKLMSLFKLNSHFLPVNMSGLITHSGSYTKLQLSSQYIAFNEQYYVELDFDFEKFAIKYSNLYVPRDYTLLNTNRTQNCIMNILDRQEPDTIVNTCKIQFFLNITVEPSLVVTEYNFYLLNIKDDIHLICSENSNFAIKAQSISIVSKSQLCLCKINIQGYELIGQSNNCTSTRRNTLYMQYTYNFVTEYLQFGTYLKNYKYGLDILNIPPFDSVFPTFLLKDNTDNTDVYTSEETKPLDLTDLVSLTKLLKNESVIYKSNLDKELNSESNLDWIDVSKNNDLFMLIASILAIVLIPLVVLLYLYMLKNKIYSFFSSKNHSHGSDDVNAGDPQQEDASVGGADSAAVNSAVVGHVSVAERSVLYPETK